MNFKGTTKTVDGEKRQERCLPESLQFCVNIERDTFVKAVHNAIGMGDPRVNCEGDGAEDIAEEATEARGDKVFLAEADYDWHYHNTPRPPQSVVISREDDYCQTSLDNKEVNSGIWNGITILKNFVGDIDFRFTLGQQPLGFALRIFRNGKYIDIIPAETCKAGSLAKYSLRGVDFQRGDVIRYFYSWSGASLGSMLTVDSQTGRSVYIKITDSSKWSISAVE